MITSPASGADHTHATICEHAYEVRMLGGHPISVRLCALCRTPDWDDLNEQAVALYRWGWQEGSTGVAPRVALTAYDRPRPEGDQA
ncbi:hypothetical protein ACWDCO_24195 [Streptomyces albogriseolus]